MTSLEKAGELPDLSGDEVVFQGLGDTAEPQPSLSRAQRTNLIDIWTAIANAAGAASVDVDPSPLSGDSASGLPSVTVVTPPPTDLTAGTITLTGGDVAFQPDSAAFLDQIAVTDVVRPIAEQLVASGVTATVTGTTARVGDTAGQVELSQRRAQAVKDLLTALGVPVTGSWRAAARQRVPRLRAGPRPGRHPRPRRSRSQPQGGDHLRRHRDRPGLQRHLTDCPGSGEDGHFRRNRGRGATDQARRIALW